LYVTIAWPLPSTPSLTLVALRSMISEADADADKSRHAQKATAARLLTLLFSALNLEA
jgi:hypothetical protein